MRRALARLSVVPDHILLDGKPIRTLESPHTAIVGGDDACYTIACASILAKVTRDRIMRALAAHHPNYLWEKNVGYSTMKHLKGIAAHGVTPHHRGSFIPVHQLSLDFSGQPGGEIDVSALASMIEAAPAVDDDSVIAGD